MNRNTMKLLLAALCLTTACETWPQQVPAQGVGEVSEPLKLTTSSDCSGCSKWITRPPLGLNGPGH